MTIIIIAMLYIVHYALFWYNDDFSMWQGRATWLMSVAPEIDSQRARPLDFFSSLEHCRTEKSIGLGESGTHPRERKRRKLRIIYNQRRRRLCNDDGWTWRARGIDSGRCDTTACVYIIYILGDDRRTLSSSGGWMYIYVYTDIICTGEWKKNKTRVRD